MGVEDALDLLEFVVLYIVMLTIAISIVKPSLSRLEEATSTIEVYDKTVDKLEGTKELTDLTTGSLTDDQVALTLLSQNNSLMPAYSIPNCADNTSEFLTDAYLDANESDLVENKYTVVVGNTSFKMSNVYSIANGSAIRSSLRSQYGLNRNYIITVSEDYTNSDRDLGDNIYKVKVYNSTDRVYE